MNPRKQRFYIAAAGVLAVIALLWSVIGSPVVLWHNHQLKTALTGLTDTSITLEQAVPFSWDEVYTFAPYTSVEEIQEVIGATSFNLKEAESEGVLQLVFLDGGAVTAALPPPRWATTWTWLLRWTAPPASSPTGRTFPLRWSGTAA